MWIPHSLVIMNKSLLLEGVHYIRTSLNIANVVEEKCQKHCEVTLEKLKAIFSKLKFSVSVSSKRGKNMVFKIH